jgi:hypothetical protein
MSCKERLGQGWTSGLLLNGSARTVRSFIVILLFISLGLPGQTSAQDLEPRRWSHLPTGQNIVGVGYIYTEANVFFSPVWKITDGTSRINGLGISAIHTFDMAGKSARFSLMLPYISGRWEGDIDDEFQVIHRRGVGDPRLRLSVNLYGAPALKGAEFAQYLNEHTSNTVVGASIAVTMPLGKYCDDCLINVSNNRWMMRPQIGVVHTRGPWSFELTSSAFIFTDNDDFLDNAVLKQKTMYAIQAHAIYSFKPGLWASLSTGYGAGGRIHIDQLKTKFEVDNWIWAASLGFPIGQTQSLKLTWLSGRTQNLVGRDSDNLQLSWMMRWTN